MPVDLGHGFFLRQAEASDHDGLSMVCLQTGNAGEDASAIEDDPRLLGAIFAVPFQVLEPNFAFVIADDAGVCGYLLGTPDTAGFYRKMDAEWLPRWRGLVNDPGDDQALWRGSDWLRHEIHHPRFLYPDALYSYSAQGHIDMLPRARGKGVGRKAMLHLMEMLAAAKAPGLHLQVNPRNVKAQGFYASIGFRRMTDDKLPEDTIFMVRGLP